MSESERERDGISSTAEAAIEWGVGRENALKSKHILSLHTIIDTHTHTDFHIHVLHSTAKAILKWPDIAFSLFHSFHTHFCLISMRKYP